VSTGRIEVTAPRSCKPKPGIHVHRARTLPSPTSVNGIPVTGPARTLVDLGDVLSAERLAKAVEQAERLRVFDLTAVERELRGRGGRLRAVLAEHRPEAHLLRSEAERRLKRLCEAVGLPLPRFNLQLHGYEVDAHWPDAHLVVEVDGAETHATRTAFHRDRRRDRALAAQGVQVLRVTWPDLEEKLVDQLRAILRRR
jgi:very-short-patch-repair endonuclease